MQQKLIEMILPEEAWERIAGRLRRLPTEAVPRRQAYGRVLAEPLLATVDVPAHDVSAMDGFAVGGDIQSGDRRRLGGTVAAGDAPGARVEAGQALRIMTGAPLPVAADRVVPVEQTELIGEEVAFLSAVEVGAHIRHRAEVLGVGEVLLEASTPLTPGALSLLATHGHASVTVYRRPKVAVLATGDEVVPPESEPRPGQLRDSHTDFLIAAGRSLGLEFESLGIAPDQPAAIRERVKRGLEVDVLLVSGGVSMGEFDYVENVMRESGCELLFDSVAIQPGKPIVVASHANGFVFGLPGNPASVMVGFWLFVKPLLRCVQGFSDGYWQGALRAELVAPLPEAKGRDRFLSAEVDVQEGRLLVKPRLSKGSHDVAAFGRGSALVRVRAGSQVSAAGEPCEVLPLAHWPLRA